jgi:hypothetical protein
LLRVFGRLLSLSVSSLSLLLEYCFAGVDFIAGVDLFFGVAFVTAGDALMGGFDRLLSLSVSSLSLSLMYFFEGADCFAGTTADGGGAALLITGRFISPSLLSLSLSLLYCFPGITTLLPDDVVNLTFFGEVGSVGTSMDRLVGVFIAAAGCCCCC